MALLNLPIDVVANLTFDLCPRLNCRSGEEVTMDTFACLCKVNTMTLLNLPFDVVFNLTFDL